MSTPLNSSGTQFFTAGNPVHSVTQVQHQIPCASHVSRSSPSQTSKSTPFKTLAIPPRPPPQQNQSPTSPRDPHRNSPPPHQCPQSQLQSATVSADTTQPVNSRPVMVRKSTFIGAQITDILHSQNGDLQVLSYPIGSPENGPITERAIHGNRSGPNDGVQYPTQCEQITAAGRTKTLIQQPVSFVQHKSPSPEHRISPPHSPAHSSTSEPGSNYTENKRHSPQSNATACISESSPTVLPSRFDQTPPPLAIEILATKTSPVHEQPTDALAIPSTTNGDQTLPGYCHSLTDTASSSGLCVDSPEKLVHPPSPQQPPDEDNLGPPSIHHPQPINHNPQQFPQKYREILEIPSTSIQLPLTPPATPWGPFPPPTLQASTLPTSHILTPPLTPRRSARLETSQSLRSNLLPTSSHSDLNYNSGPTNLQDPLYAAGPADVESISPLVDTMVDRAGTKDRLSPIGEDVWLQRRQRGEAAKGSASTNGQQSAHPSPQSQSTSSTSFPSQSPPLRVTNSCSPDRSVLAQEMSHEDVGSTSVKRVEVRIDRCSIDHI